MAYCLLKANFVMQEDEPMRLIELLNHPSKVGLRYTTILYMVDSHIFGHGVWPYIFKLVDDLDKANQ